MAETSQKKEVVMAEKSSDLVVFVRHDSGKEQLQFVRDITTHYH